MVKKRSPPLPLSLSLSLSIYLSSFYVAKKRKDPHPIWLECRLWRGVSLDDSHKHADKHFLSLFVWESVTVETATMFVFYYRGEKPRLQDNVWRYVCMDRLHICNGWKPPRQQTKLNYLRLYSQWREGGRWHVLWWSVKWNLSQIM